MINSDEVLFKMYQNVSLDSSNKLNKTVSLGNYNLKSFDKFISLYKNNLEEINVNINNKNSMEEYKKRTICNSVLTDAFINNDNELINKISNYLFFNDNVSKEDKLLVERELAKKDLDIMFKVENIYNTQRKTIYSDCKKELDKIKNNVYKNPISGMSELFDAEDNTLESNLMKLAKMSNNINLVDATSQLYNNIRLFSEKDKKNINKYLLEENGLDIIISLMRNKGFDASKIKNSYTDIKNALNVNKYVDLKKLSEIFCDYNTKTNNYSSILANSVFKGIKSQDIDIIESLGVDYSEEKEDDKRKIIENELAYEILLKKPEIVKSIYSSSMELCNNSSTVKKIIPKLIRKVNNEISKNPLIFANNPNNIKKIIEPFFLK